VASADVSKSHKPFAWNRGTGEQIPKLGGRSDANDMIDSKRPAVKNPG
jgi:hypothetical protein